MKKKIATEDKIHGHVTTSMAAEEISVNKKNTKEFFLESRESDSEGLLNNGTLKSMSRDDVPKGARVAGTQYIDGIKRAGQ